MYSMVGSAVEPPARGSRSTPAAAERHTDKDNPAGNPDDHGPSTLG
jgi:hypothetical protein